MIHAKYNLVQNCILALLVLFHSMQLGLLYLVSIYINNLSYFDPKFVMNSLSVCTTAEETDVLF